MVIIIVKAVLTSYEVDISCKYLLSQFTRIVIA